MLRIFHLAKEFLQLISSLRLANFRTIKIIPNMVILIIPIYWDITNGVPDIFLIR